MDFNKEHFIYGSLVMSMLTTLELGFLQQY